MTARTGDMPFVRLIATPIFQTSMQHLDIYKKKAHFSALFQRSARMSQEWDYPPPRKWREEEFVRPSKRDRFEQVIDHLPKPKTAWQWYVRQMQGRGHWLYKANVSALFFTVIGAFFLIVAAIGALVGFIISMR
ncbi:hypothetical protein [Rhizobium lusitanum]|uniref:hypothetical protein n=1 Tax=Rhizobium lusitanum TaxID=293958 RepID=UPI00195EE995|nr:hypothetical protein [Rhizobium lusitanum]MBM7045446.1 hypothetical protein [Rhizobium lusitanum]